MEEEQSYIVEITPEGELFYLHLLEYLYTHNSIRSADQKSDEILDMAMSLNKQPYRGKKEAKLAILGKEHRFLVYRYTPRKTIKIIYFIEEADKKVYVTDFFPTEKDDEEIKERGNKIQSN